MFKFLRGTSIFALCLSLPFAAGSHFASADETSLEVPKRAWTKTKVEQTFGAPRNKRSPVGTPPITTWEYSDFNVYFEYNRVIHSVKHYTIRN